MRKLRITLMQLDILCMLEEAGEENIPCIRATLGYPDEVEFGQQVDTLERIGLIGRSMERVSDLPSLVLTPEGRRALMRRWSTRRNLPHLKPWCYAEYLNIP